MMQTCLRCPHCPTSTCWPLAAVTKGFLQDTIGTRVAWRTWAGLDHDIIGLGKKQNYGIVDLSDPLKHLGQELSS